MSSFFIKIIACLSMLLDHLNYALPERLPILGFLGRLAFPLFAFQIAEGYAHTGDFKKYALRLAVFAVISQYPFRLLMEMTGGSYQTLNIFFTLFMGLLAIRAYDVLPCKGAVVAGILIASRYATLIQTDYGQWGVLLIFGLYIVRKNRVGQLLMLLLLTLVYYGETMLSMGEVSLSAVGVMLSYLFIALYNGRRGYKGAGVKYFMYVFYPAHILVLYGLFLLLR